MSRIRVVPDLNMVLWRPVSQISCDLLQLAITGYGVNVGITIIGRGPPAICFKSVKENRNALIGNGFGCSLSRERRDTAGKPPYIRGVVRADCGRGRSATVRIFNSGTDVGKDEITPWGSRRESFSFKRPDPGRGFAVCAQCGRRLLCKLKSILPTSVQEGERDSLREGDRQLQCRLFSLFRLYLFPIADPMCGQPDESTLQPHKTRRGRQKIYPSRTRTKLVVFGTLSRLLKLQRFVEQAATSFGDMLSIG